jgi:hypothetical protein
MWTPATPNAPPTAAQPVGPDVSGSPVPIAPGAEDAAPTGDIEIPGALEGAEARVTTDPAVLPLAAPLRPGLTQEQVRQVKGTPALISRNDQAGIETWSYPDGSITFQGGRLTTWKLQSVAPSMEPVARRAPRATPAEERMAMGATDIEIPEAAAPPRSEPAEKIVPEEKSVEKVAQLRTTTRTTTKKVRRGHRRSHRSAWHHRRHHRFAWGRHRSHRYASTRYRRHHRWAKGTVRTTGRHASAGTHCRLCQMARAHLRSGHRVVMSEVAGWRARSAHNATAKVRPQQRKTMVLQRR